MKQRLILYEDPATHRRYTNIIPRDPHRLIKGGIARMRVLVFAGSICHLNTRNIVLDKVIDKELKFLLRSSRNYIDRY
jgi:hypothetical protein